MNLEEIVMKIILYSGNAKGKAFEAISAAKEQNIPLARELMNKANEELVEAHKAQTSLIQSEAHGEKTEITVLLIHAQDHLMNAITFKDLANEFVDLYETINS